MAIHMTKNGVVLTMDFVYHDHANEGGVYQIKNLQNNRIYYGSTVRFKQRAREHMFALANNKHHSAFLQRDFDACGSDVFVFEVVEVVSPIPNNPLASKQARLTREQEYITKNLVDRSSCYNMRPDATNTGYATWKEERREKQSKAMKHLYANRPDLKETSSKNAKKRWKGHSADITLVNKDAGEEVCVKTSLREFAFSRGLSYKSLNQLTNGKTKSCGGWYVKDKGAPVYVSQKGQKRKPLTSKHRDKIAGSKYLGMKVLDPAGTVVSVPRNVNAFCKKRGLHYTTFLRVLKGTLKTCGGWKLL